MNRREVISRVALLLGGTIVGADVFLSGCKFSHHDEKSEFNPAELALLDEIGDTIIPPTDSPGAKATKIGAFMLAITRDCYKEKDRLVFNEGMKKIDEACQEMNKKTFMKCNAEERHALLSQLDKEQLEYMKNKKDGEPSHYFRMMKELTLWGYFSSEAGMTKALRYVQVPGKFIGCEPYKKGDKAWA